MRRAHISLYKAFSFPLNKNYILYSYAFTIALKLAYGEVVLALLMYLFKDKRRTLTSINKGFKGFVFKLRIDIKS